MRKGLPFSTRYFAFSLALFLIALAPAEAQNLSGHNWYFGNSNQAIRFSRSTNSPSLFSGKATPFGTGGSATASDPFNANLLFYTDGASVYDVSN
ncbi:MAG TPA: hypothetical protein VF490_04565, partial [Chryseosolibacter sp.]